MRGFIVGSLVLAAALVTSCRKAPEPADARPASSGRGTITGHIRLTGTPPENPPIRMRADPMCDKANAGKRALQETVIAGADGSLANVFVQLEGSFPDAGPAPTEPVTVDQTGCIYGPRVVGVRVGQPLRVKNSDPGLHNVHGVSADHDAFNVGQPIAGMINTMQVHDEGILKLQCDVHTWMVAFVGVVNHPYFAVTSTPGTFELRDVPAGTYTIRAWHELYGVHTTSVTVRAGAPVGVDFTYSATADEKAPTP